MGVALLVFVLAGVGLDEVSVTPGDNGTFGATAETEIIPQSNPGWSNAGDSSTTSTGDTSAPVGPVVPVVGEPSVVTVGMVWSAVREVPVPAAVLVVAPPGGETLVNLETVFSTEVGEFSTSVVLLGQRVRLVLSPVWFRWVAGDGVSWVTSGPGVGYSPGLPMGGYVSHRYVRAGVVSARVDVGWAARFSVAGGPWQEVAGRVVVVGVPVELRVREAAPRLVG